jgi:signal transduction histidine kinase
MNILINAVDSLLDQSLSEVEMQIIIKTKQENNQLIISISDNGPGIPKEIQDKIFDPFFTTKDVGKGVGLGLSIAHGIIEQHGGTIEVESGKDNGTDFRILLTNLKNN